MDQIVTGVITAYQGTSPGPASQLSYTIKWNEPGGGIGVADGQIPQGWRWPDECWTNGARMVGIRLHGVLTSEGRIEWTFTECPHFGPCTDQPGPGSGGVRIGPDGLPLPPQPPTPGGNPPPDGSPAIPSTN